MGFFSDLWNSIKHKASDLWSGVKNTAMNVWNTIKKPIGMIPGIGGKIVAGVEGIGNAVNHAAEGIGHLANGRIGDAISSGKAAIGAGTEGAAKFATMKKGGMVIKPMPPAGGGIRPFVMHDGIPVPVSFQK